VPHKDPDVRRAYAAKWAREHPRTPPNPEARQRTMKKYNLRKNLERRSYVNEIKVSLGCCDCGYRDRPEALHFDHRDPSTKLFNVATGLARPRDVIDAEISKCDVVCVNCHVVRTIDQHRNGLLGAELMTGATRVANRRRNLERRAYVNAIKLSAGCADCGYNQRPEALHFDHRDPATKLFDVARGLARPIDVLNAEIAKCEVVCGRCHVIRTVSQHRSGVLRTGPTPKVHSRDA
jgi:hypothetical protein